MKRPQSGYTLIELMTVTSIVAVLSAIAIPAYTDYLVRAMVAEALHVAGATTTTVAEYYMTNSTLPTTNQAAGMSTVFQTKYVSGVTITTVGSIRIGLRGHPLLSGKTIVYTPDATPARVDWSCQGGTLENSRRPPICR